MQELKEHFIIGMIITVVFTCFFLLFVLVYDSVFADYKVLKSSNYICSFQSTRSETRSETRFYNTVSIDAAGNPVVGLESYVDNYYLYRCLESENKKISFNKEFMTKYPLVIYLREEIIYVFGFLKEYVSTKEYINY